RAAADLSCHGECAGEVGVPLPHALSHGSGHVPRGYRLPGDRGMIRSASWMMPALLSLTAAGLAQSDPQVQSVAQAKSIASGPATGERPPQPQTLPPMSSEDMRRVMHMDDSHRFGTLMFDELEWRGASGVPSGAWDAQGWYGG